MMTLAPLRRRIELLLLPELTSIAPHHRERALADAREEPLDFIEIIGVLAGLVIASLLTRYSLADAHLTDRLLAALVNFAVALPLIAVLVGPFLIRRTRRGLQRFLQSKAS